MAVCPATKTRTINSIESRADTIFHVSSNIAFPGWPPGVAASGAGVHGGGIASAQTETGDELRPVNRNGRISFPDLHPGDSGCFEFFLNFFTDEFRDIFCRGIDHIEGLQIVDELMIQILTRCAKPAFQFGKIIQKSVLVQFRAFNPTCTR